MSGPGTPASSGVAAAVAAACEPAASVAALGLDAGIGVAALGCDAGIGVAAADWDVEAGACAGAVVGAAAGAPPHAATSDAEATAKLPKTTCRSACLLLSFSTSCPPVDASSRTMLEQPHCILACLNESRRNAVHVIQTGRSSSLMASGTAVATLVGSSVEIGG